MPLLDNINFMNIISVYQNKGVKLMKCGLCTYEHLRPSQKTILHMQLKRVMSSTQANNVDYKQLHKADLCRWDHTFYDIIYIYIYIYIYQGCKRIYIHTYMRRLTKIVMGEPVTLMQ